MQEYPGAPVPDSAENGETPRGGIAGFLSTTLGKLVVGGIILVVLLGVLGAIAVFFLFSAGQDLIDQVTTPPASVPTTQSAEAEPVERAEPRLDDHFAFRNIIAPTVKPSVPTTPAGSDDASPTPGGVNLPPDTLYLESIAVVDGETVATLWWNGQSYVVAAGEDLTGTPWRVVSISGTTVTMLYGDTTITLTVGQALGK